MPAVEFYRFIWPRYNFPQRHVSSSFFPSDSSREFHIQFYILLPPSLFSSFESRILRRLEEKKHVCFDKNVTRFLAVVS